MEFPLLEAKDLSDPLDNITRDKSVDQIKITTFPCSCIFQRKTANSLLLFISLEVSFNVKYVLTLQYIHVRLETTMSYEINEPSLIKVPGRPHRCFLEMYPLK